VKLALVALLLGLALAGCGAEESTDTSPGAGATSATPTSSEEPATSLTIEVAQTGFDHGVTQTTTLECDPVGGTNPLQDEACAQLAAHPEALEPVPENTACTMIFGGPEEARVYGTIDGEEIDAEFSKANGCELARWEALEPLFKVVVD
jgi:Subtilisin inhibitor-like